MSKYIISLKELAILMAKCHGMKLVEEDGTPVCDPSEIAESVDKPLVIKEIVQCENCEFEINGYCSHPDEWNDDLWFPVEPDGFCSWGERHKP